MFFPEFYYSSKLNWVIILELTHRWSPGYRLTVSLSYPYLSPHISNTNNVKVMTIWAFLFYWLLDSIMHTVYLDRIGAIVLYNFLKIHSASQWNSRTTEGVSEVIWSHTQPKQHLKHPRQMAASSKGIQPE